MFFNRRKHKKQREKRVELQRVKLSRDLSSMRKRCHDSAEEAFEKLKTLSARDDQLARETAVAIATDARANVRQMKKIDKTRRAVRENELRAEAVSVDRLLHDEFKITYDIAKTSAKSSNVSKTRKRAQNLEAYRAKNDYVRDVVNDTLKNTLRSDSDSESEDDDVAALCEKFREDATINSLLAAPNPHCAIVDGDLSQILPEH